MDKPIVPEHLQEALDKAIHDIAMFIHEHSRMSVVILDVRHASDAVIGRSQTIVGSVIAGEPVTPGPKHPNNKPVDAVDAKVMVDDLVARLMEQAKKGGNQ